MKLLILSITLFAATVNANNDNNKKTVNNTELQNDLKQEYKNQPLESNFYTNQPTKKQEFIFRSLETGSLTFEQAKKEILKTL